mgnify:CR=1 FL=1
MNDNETESKLYVDDDLYKNTSNAREACECRSNRYSPFGSPISRLSVRFSWNGISFGEIRDLNRHRTGNKYCPLIPVGFYGSTDQIPTKKSTNLNLIEKIYSLQSKSYYEPSKLDFNFYDSKKVKPDDEERFGILKIDFVPPFVPPFLHG